jgi:hypothetical protein
VVPRSRIIGTAHGQVVLIMGFFKTSTTACIAYGLI